MGGGSKAFIPETEEDKHGKPGIRKDGKNLVIEWLRDKESRGAKARAIFDLKEMKSINPNDIDYLMGKLCVFLIHIPRKIQDKK